LRVVIDVPSTFRHTLLPSVLALALAAMLGGCLSEQIEENNRLIRQQQAQLEDLQKQIDALKTQQFTPTPPPGATCDKGVMATATRRGGERFAAGDFARALGYYQDALTACPGDAHAEVNLARTYEAQGNKTAAVEHYRRAAASTDSSEPDAQRDARTALQRLTGAI
jgi:tetratricopeptide (TPR) repeat protein